MTDALKRFGVSLYDYFAFLIPGLAFFAAAGVTAWALWAPDAVLVRPAFSAEVWVAVLILGYLCGHVVQALANLIDSLDMPLFRRWREAEPERVRTRLEDDGVTDAVIEQAKSRARGGLGLTDDSDVDLKLLSKLGEELSAREGLTRLEMYAYREGFYRGGVIALTLLAGSLLFRSLRGDAVLVAPRPDQPSEVLHIVELPFLSLLTLAAIVLAAAILWFMRFQRFAAGADARSILAFIVLTGFPLRDEQQ